MGQRVPTQTRDDFLYAPVSSRTGHRTTTRRVDNWLEGQMVMSEAHPFLAGSTSLGAADDGGELTPGTVSSAPPACLAAYVDGRSRARRRVR